jgi:TolA-binding protein
VVGVALVSIVLLGTASSASAQDRLFDLSLDRWGKLREVERYQLQVAEKFFREANWKAAQDEYEKFVELYEKSAAASYAQLQYAECLRRQKQVNAAIKDGYQAVLDYWPDAPDAPWADYAIALAHRSAGDVEKARARYQAVISERASHFVATRSKVDLAAMARELGQTEAYIAALGDLVFDTPRNKENTPIIHHSARELAGVQFAAANFEAGMTALETAHQKDDLLHQMRNHLIGPLHSLRGDKAGKGTQLVEAAVKRVLDAAPLQLDTDADKSRWASLRHIIAQLYRAAAQGPKAIAIYQDMMKTLGENDGLWGEVGDTQAEMGQHAESRATYGRFKDPIAGLVRIAGSYRRENKLPEAIDVYRQLMARDADHAKQWQWEIAELTYALGKYRDALAIFRQVDLPPRDLQRISDCHRALKEWDEAIVILRQVQATYKDLAPWALLQIGYCQEGKGEKDPAINTFKTVCKLYPRTGEASVAHQHLEADYKITVTLGGVKGE